MTAPPMKRETPNWCGTSRDQRPMRRWALILGACLLLVVAGCSEGQSIRRIQQCFVDANASDEQLWTAYERLLKLPAEEDMDYWVRIVNDHTRQPEQRLLAFHAFWGRALRPGMTLQQLARRYDIASWFSAATVKDAGSASQLPASVEAYRESGWDRYGFVGRMAFP
jgi:hypothetical protein